MCERGAVQSEQLDVFGLSAQQTGLIVVSAKKLAVFAGVALVLFFVIAQPGQAAGLVNNIIGFLRSAAELVISFVSGVFA